MPSESEDEELVFLNKSIDSFSESGYTAYIILVSKDGRNVKYISNLHLLETPEPFNKQLYMVLNFLWYRVFKDSGFIKYLSKLGEITIVQNGKFEGGVSDVSRN